VVPGLAFVCGNIILLIPVLMLLIPSRL